MRNGRTGNARRRAFGAEKETHIHTYLLEMLVCPACHGELAWSIVARSRDRIDTATARCAACAAAYPVRESIGLFLTPQRQHDGRQEQESRQLRYVREHPEIERQLLESPLDALNPADQHFLALVLEARGEYAQAKAAADLAQAGLYTPESRAGVKSQFGYLMEHLSASDGPIVDLASGRCYLVEELLRALQRPIVASDLSVPVLRRDRRYLEFWGLYDRVSLLAFDARCTPFRDSAVETMTTFVGLQSVRTPGNILPELRRVVSRKLLPISMFFSEGDDIHAPVIRQAGLETTLFRAPALDAFAKTGWHTEVANAHLVKVRPTPTGVLLQGFKVDGFPLAETSQESCVIVAQ